MRKIVLLLLVISFAPAALADEGIVKKLSARSVQDTMDNLEGIVKKKGFTVFARVDHAAGASKVGETLRPTQLLIFGNPKVGTALMTSSQSIGLDLPIKVLAWEDSEGMVWLAYNEPAYIAERHGIEDKEAVVSKMTGALKGITDAATTP